MTDWSPISPKRTPVGDSLLTIKDVSVSYPSNGWRAKPTRVLHEVSLDIRAGEAVGLVGESGSGKTTLGRAILGLVPVESGEIELEGRDLMRLTSAERRNLSADVQVVFQDPYSSLNSALTIGESLAEPMLVAGVSRADARRRTRELLDQVSLPSNSAERFPREFSGGQRQRIAIARALTRSPKLIVCDEPVSALDLSTQARILDLFIEIQNATGVAYLFITHDLSVVRYVCHRVSVMNHGRIVESGDTVEVTEHPHDLYTQRLLLSAPVPDPRRQAERRRERESLFAS